MWTSQYDIIVETLTGAEFEMTVTDKDTIGYIKSRIQKYEGIPIGQQHLLYNHKELSDTTEMKDIPLASGSRLKLVLHMNGGPASARRVVSLPDYDNWFDLSDVFNTTSSRHDPLTISTPGVKLLVYKDCKKNVHRIMKLRSDRKTQNSARTNESATFTSDNNDQWVKDNLQTIQKMHQLKMQLEQKKRNKDSKKQKYGNNGNRGIINGDDNDNKLKMLTDSSGITVAGMKNQTQVVIDQITKLTPLMMVENRYHHPQPQQQQQQRKNSSYEFPVPIMPRKSSSSSSGLLNKYGLNKTCIRPPSSFVTQQQQHQQYQIQQQQQQHKNESNFFQLHALSPLTLPTPGISSASNTSSLSPSSSSSSSTLSKFAISSSGSENNIKDSFNSRSPATVGIIDRPKLMRQNTSAVITNNTSSDLDMKMKLRENIRRNRSFKMINSTIDLATAASSDTVADLLQNSHLSFNTPINNRSLSSMIDQIFSNVSATGGYKNVAEKQNTSKSVQDLIEKFATTSLNTESVSSASPSSPIIGGVGVSDLAIKMNNEYDPAVVGGGGIRLPKLTNCLNVTTAALNSNGFENKIFLDRHQHHSSGSNPLQINSTMDTTLNGGYGDYKLEAATAATASTTATSALDNGSSFRLYKMASADAKNNYELPKLLIREDSPVESFHSLSDPQLETLAIHGGGGVGGDSSPKNSTLDVGFPKLSPIDAINLVDSNDACGLVDDEISGAPTTTTAANKTIIKTPWNNLPHSDLGVDNLELHFFNEDDYSDLNLTKSNVDNCNGSGITRNGSVLKIAASNLEINSSCWNSNSNSELDGQSQPSTTSLNFINGDLTSSDDDEEENLFNSNNGGGSCCMLHNSKSKSVELNDFRMMFGSSPTLLNSTNYNSVTHTSRLDAVPIQYRRGYTNLNDACLSSSTSDLELFNGIRKKNSSKSASQELPSAAYSSRYNSLRLHNLHHHHHHHYHYKSPNADSFARSYENLCRAKNFIRMKNEQQQQQQLQQQQQQQQQHYYKSQQQQHQPPLHQNRGGGGNSLLTKGTLKHFWDNATSSPSTASSSFNGSSKRLHRNFSHEKLQEEDFYIDDDVDFSYANLGYENNLITTTTIGDGSGCGDNDECGAGNINSNRANDCLPLSNGFPSDESLFNMNLDRFTDEFNLLSSISLRIDDINGSRSGGDGDIGNNSNHRHQLLSPNSHLLQSSNDNDDYNNCELGKAGGLTMTPSPVPVAMSTPNTNQSSLLLSDFDIDGKSTIKKVSSKKISDRRRTAAAVTSSSVLTKSSLSSANINDDDDVDDDIAQAMAEEIINATESLLKFSKRTTTATAETIAGSISSTSRTVGTIRNNNVKLMNNENDETTVTSSPPKKLRCAECKKKLGLIIMKCHCEKVFCSQHRYAEAHNCSYNFKMEGKKILSRENPLVVAQKLNKI